MALVETTRDGQVAVVKLNSDETRNALSTPMVDAVIKALEEAEDDADVRAILLTAAGRAFCAGGDVKEMANKQGMFAGDAVSIAANYRTGIQRLPRLISKLRKPIVAGINGAAIGAGLDLALMCDLRVCAASAKLGSTFVKVGITPGDGGSWFLTRLLGTARALELVLTGDILTAERAQQIGLVTAVVPDDELPAKALALARKLAALPPTSVQYAKQLVKSAWTQTVDEHLDQASALQALCHQTPEHAEAVKPFMSL